MQKRIDWIDASKGAGIILVIIGHNPALNTLDFNWIHSSIYAFHMPLFFMLSGILNKGGDLQSIFKKAKSLLLPYFFCCLLFAAWRSHNEEINFGLLLTSSLAFYGDNLPQPHLWFLPTLFIVYCVFNIPFWRKSSLWMPYITALTIAMLYSSAGVITRIFNLDLIALCSLFYLLGFLLKDRLSRELESTGNEFFFWAVFSFVTISAFVYFYPNTSSLDLNLRILSGELTLVTAAILSVSFIIFAPKVDSLIGGLFSYIGSRTIVIFCFHYIIQGKLYRTLTDLDFGVPLSFATSFFASLAICLAIDAIVRRVEFLRFIFYNTRSSLR